MSQKIVICGSFGFGNLGDEILEPSFVAAAQRAGLEDVTFHRLGRYEEHDLAEVLTIGKADRERLRELRDASFVFAGGGIVEAKDNSALVRIGTALREVGVKEVYSMGINADAGVKYSGKRRLQVGRTLMAMKVVRARDVISHGVIRGLLPIADVRVSGDSALSFPEFTGSPSLDLPERFVVVSLCARWDEDPGFLSWIAKELIETAAQLNCAIVYLPMSCARDDDRVVHRRVADEVARLDPTVAQQLLEAAPTAMVCAEVLRRSLGCVGMRLHACVLAYGQRRPFVALAYHPKIVGFARTVHADQLVVPADAKAQERNRYGWGFSAERVGSSSIAHLLEQAQTMSYASLDYFREEQARILRETLALR